MDAYKLMEELMLVPGCSGREERVAALMKEKLSPLCDEVWGDRNGNVVGTLRGTDPEGYSMMLFAHMDQVGYVVTGIADDGSLRVDKNGSVAEKVAPGCALLVRTEGGAYIPGCVGVMSAHAMSAAERANMTPLAELCVDIGVHSWERAHELGIYPGCTAVYRPFFARMDGSMITGTAIDNRGGCCTLILCAEELRAARPKVTVHFVATVQEEHNLRGVLSAANILRPDIAIGIDVSLASDSLGLSGLYNNATGTGPCITYYSHHGRGTLNGVIGHEGLAKLALAAAAEREIPINRFAARGILTDLTYVQGVGKGAASLDMSFPVKYTHSPSEVCDVEDIRKLAAVCAGMAGKIDRGFKLERF